MNFILNVVSKNPIFHFASILGFCFIGIKLNLLLKTYLSKKKFKQFIIPSNFLFLFFWLFTINIIDQFLTNSELYSRSILLSSVYFALIIAIFIISNTLILNEKDKKNAIEKEKLKLANLQNELSALKNQLNPHFLFNTLNSLLYIVRENNEDAENFIKNMSFLYRYILQSREINYVTIKEELKFIESFIYLLKHRHKDSIELNNTIDSTLYSKQIPPLSIQILVENAVKHNHVSTTSPLIIDVYSEDNYIIVKNKIKKREGKVISTFTGLNNLNSRFKLLIDKEIEIIKTDYFIVKIPLS